MVLDEAIGSPNNPSPDNISSALLKELKGIKEWKESKLKWESCNEWEYGMELSLEWSQELYLCTKCSSAFKKKQDYASTKNGTACITHSKKGISLVQFTCRKGHQWSVNMLRSYKNWCSVCIKEAKEQKKKEYKRQSNELNRENIDRQRKLFEDAKNKYLAQTKDIPFTSFEDLLESNSLLHSVLPEAKLKATADWAQPKAPCTYKQALAVYKVLLLDAARVKFILKGVSLDSKKVGFKKLALSLHPDKNRHPLSNEAFLKASELLNTSSS